MENRYFYNTDNFEEKVYDLKMNIQLTRSPAGMDFYTSLSEPCDFHLWVPINEARYNEFAKDWLNYLTQRLAYIQKINPEPI